MKQVHIPPDAPYATQRGFNDVVAALRDLQQQIDGIGRGVSHQELSDLRKEFNAALRKKTPVTWWDVFGTYVVNDTALKDYYARHVTRGMQLRTDPDIGGAATKVKVLRADEIVFDDGYKQAVTAPMTADITVSGAGGRDTGTEQNSTWYEVYAIHGPDKTATLLLHRSKDYFLDESSTSGEDGEHMLRRATAPVNNMLGQGFDNDVGGPVEFVDLKLIRNGAVAAGTFVAVSIYANAAGVPTGSALATSDKIDASKISTSAQWIRFVFRTPLTLVANTTYHLVLSGDYTASDTVNIRWRADTTAAGYANGSKSFENGSGTWAADADDDFMFKTYATENDSAVVMPSGYTRKSKLGYVYNDSGGNFVPFFAKDHLVSPLVNTPLGSFANTFPTLVDLFTFIPPGTIALSCAAYNATNGAHSLIAPVPDGFGMADASRSAGAARQLQTTGASGAQSDMAGILTEYQGFYAMVTAGTLDAELETWVW